MAVLIVQRVAVSGENRLSVGKVKLTTLLSSGGCFVVHMYVYRLFTYTGSTLHSSIVGGC